MVIKSEQTIEAQNKYLKAQGYVVLDDPRTWKYYLNLTGRYHVSDRPIEVLSSDTYETIVLSRDTIVDHPITALDYGPGGSFHTELLERYPEHRELIPRILSPVDMEQAIEASEFTLLYWDDRHIADNEYGLIGTIQRWLYSYRDRWHLPSFGVSDGLYPASALALLYHNLVPTIINFRLENARTAEVDEFHRWAFLGSRYRLDRYKRYLDNRQSLFLYRNIDYLKFHVGKEVTLETLLTHITEPVNIDAHRFDVTVSNERLLETLKPVPRLLDTPYKDDRPNIGVESRAPVEYGYQLTKDLARHNEEDLYTDVTRAEAAIRTTAMQSLPTGLVQMTFNPPMSDRFANPEQVRLTQWLYLASVGRYQTVHDLNLGERGSISVTAKEAAILFCYAVSQVNKTPLETIPSVWLGYPHHDRSLGQDYVQARLESPLANEGYVTELTRDWVRHPIIRDELGFDEYVDEVKHRFYLHQVSCRKPHNSTYRSQLKGVVRALYRPTIITLAPDNTDYTRWLDALNFPHRTFQPQDYYALVFTILTVVPGVNLDEGGVTRRHRAMIDIVRLLSSYGILFVEGAGLRPTMIYHYGKVEPIEWKNHLDSYFKLGFGIYGHDAKTKARICAYAEATNIHLEPTGPIQPIYVVPTGLTLNYRQRYNHVTHLEAATLTSGSVTHIPR
jgi:hypothetical protein